MKKRYILEALSLVALALGVYWFFKNLDEEIDDNGDSDLGVGSPTEADLERIWQSGGDNK
ncbi:MAG: hypothetical protein AAB884_00075 [Patescibacteria group bacterium]